jgi:acyl-homoserine-lactone acylase
MRSPKHATLSETSLTRIERLAGKTGHVNIPQAAAPFLLKRRWRRLFPLVLLLLLALFITAGQRPQPAALASSSPAAAGTEILWDTWGVPHIFASDNEGLFRAFGWAQTQSHGDLILRLYGQARGRAAEYWGQQYLESDRWVRTVGMPTRAREWYQAQSPAFRRYLDAFAAGINDYAREHARQIADEVEIVLPVTATDVLAHVQRVIHFSFVTNPQAVAAGTRRWEPSAGSNTWAIAPQRSASKRALLLANPHLPWSDFYLFYESQLAGPGIDAYGATLVGFPVMGIAFNDYLGWSHTVNTHDGQDMYELTLAAGGYRWDGKAQAFEQEEQIIKVKQSDGKLREEKLVVRRSVHGPVVAEKGGKAIALRVAGIDQPGLCEQWWEMARAKNLKEFEAALKRLQIPMFTVMYADRDGHILHLFGGRTPARPKGDYNWAGIVPGDTAATLWTKTHVYEELPRVLDPPSGWLQNANDPPWTTTFPLALKADDFPPYLAPRFMHFRAQRSARMLVEDESISFDELLKYKHSSRMELADRLLDDLIAAARRQGNELAKRAADALAAWDRSADAASRGAVLFQAFARELNRRSGSASPFATAWSENDPRFTPKGLAEPAKAVAALEAAAAQVQADYGALDVPWGEVFRVRQGQVDLPANGGPNELGIFRVVTYLPVENKRFRAAGGDSYVAAIEFSNPVRAMALIGYGNASQPGSPHLTDQLPLFSRKELRPVWRARKEIEAHLKERKVF